MIEKGYIPKASYRNTVEYINAFENALKQYLSNKYKVINFDLPILTNISNSVDINLEQKRYINFDNNNNKKIYQLVSNYSNLMNYVIWNFDLQNNECAYFKYKTIDRDAIVTNNNTMEKNIISLSFITNEENRNNDFLTSTANFIIEAINFAISESQKFFKGKLLYVDKKSYNILNIKKKYPFLSHKEAFTRFITWKKTALIYNVINEFTNSNVTEYKDPDSYDWENTIGFYLFDQILQKPIEVFLISISPNWSIYSKQKLIYNSPIESNDYINKLKSDKFAPIATVKINFDLLLYIVLNKLNINELPNINNEYNLNKIYKYFK